MKVLGIETSCDDSAVAIYCSELGLLSHKIHRQIDLHDKYGGVVPELASRDHARLSLQLVEACLDEANIKPDDLDAVAYTAGPGLMGSLMVGSALGASLGYAWQKPTIAVNHMEGHLLAPMLEDEAPEYPFLALLVSGGHTQIVGVRSFGQYELLGESLDDAAGEAFDKTAKLLGLPYPGGPHLAKLAESGTPNRFHFPRPMVNRPGLDLSFSGLKTHCRNIIEQYPEDDQTKADIAWAFEEAVVDTLCIKVQRALKQTNMKRLVIAGGVGANKKLRQRLKDIADAKGFSVYYPKIEFCTDNAAMIAYAGYQRLIHGFQTENKIECRARWPIASLSGTA